MTGVVFVNSTDPAIKDVSDANPLPVKISGTDTTDALHVTLQGINSGNPLPVTLSGVGGALPVTLTSSTNTSTIPVELKVNSLGTLPISIAGQVSNVAVDLKTLLSGEDQTKGWLSVADGASQSYHIVPTPTASGGDMPTEISVGTAATIGDFLKTLMLNVRSNTNAAVYLSQDGQAALTSGSTGTAMASAGTSVTVVATSAVTATANSLAGRVLMVTYTPTGGATPLRFRRRIVSHAAFSAATSLTFVVTHNLPAGAAISNWQVDGDASFELVPYNNPVGAVRMELGIKSTYGGWRVACDSGVDALVIGKFS